MNLGDVDSGQRYAARRVAELLAGQPDLGAQDLLALLQADVDEIAERRKRPRRSVVRVRDDLAVVLTAEEAEALQAVDGGEIEAFIVPGAVELRPVDRYAEMSKAELWEIINKNRTRR